MSNHYDEQIDTLLVTSLESVARRIHRIAEKKGWWDCSMCRGKKVTEVRVADAEDVVVAVCPQCEGTGQYRNDGEAIGLMHSELSELLEGLREGNPRSEKLGEEFSQAEEEGADLVIRLLDIASKRGWRIAEAMLAKIAVNKDRPYRHGGKEF